MFRLMASTTERLILRIVMAHSSLNAHEVQRNDSLVEIGAKVETNPIARSAYVCLLFVAWLSLLIISIGLVIAFPTIGAFLSGDSGRVIARDIAIVVAAYCAGGMVAILGYFYVARLANRTPDQHRASNLTRLARPRFGIVAGVQAVVVAGAVFFAL